MTKRQYLLQHILHLSAKLNETTSKKQRENIEQALLFYARELERVDKEQRREYIQ